MTSIHFFSAIAHQPIQFEILVARIHRLQRLHSPAGRVHRIIYGHGNLTVFLDVPADLVHIATVELHRHRFSYVGRPRCSSHHLCVTFLLSFSNRGQKLGTKSKPKYPPTYLPVLLQLPSGLQYGQRRHPRRCFSFSLTLLPPRTSRRICRACKGKVHHERL